MLPELWGGSADLAESNNTTPKGEPSFLPADRQSKEFPGGPYGRILHFGIREHAMGSILNGIALHGGTRAYGGTFLVFSDYMRPAVRLAALMKLPVTYVWTHDSIGLGEDGPTHQPVEHLAALRAIPGPRRGPARPTPTRPSSPGARSSSTPTGRPASCLTRQNLPVCDRSTLRVRPTAPPAAATSSPTPSNGQPQVILIATGSEVQLAVAARERARGRGHADPGRLDAVRRVVPRAGQAYRSRCCPAGSRPGSASRPASRMGWRDIVGDAGEIVSLEHYGASAAHTVLFEQFGFTPDNVVAAAHASLERVHIITGSTTGS